MCMRRTEREEVVDDLLWVQAISELLSSPSARRTRERSKTHGGKELVDEGFNRQMSDRLELVVDDEPRNELNETEGVDETREGRCEGREESAVERQKRQKIAQTDCERVPRPRRRKNVSYGDRELRTRSRDVATTHLCSL